MKKSKKNLIKVVLSVSGIVLISKILGFVRQIFMAGFFGATIETDVISLSHGLITNIEYIISHTLATAFVPVYLFSKKAEHAEKRLVSDSLKLFTIIIGFVVAFLMVAAPFVARIIAPTYKGESLEMLVRYIRVFSPLLVLFVQISIFRALLNARESFLPGEMIGLVGSIVMIVAILFFSDRWGIDSIAISYWGAMILTIVYLGVVSRKEWKLEKGNPLNNPHIRKLASMITPLFLGYAMIFVNQQIDKIIISGMPAGTVTAMSYGNATSQLVVTLIASFCMVIYTRLSSNVSEGNHEIAGRTTIKIASILITVLLPITVVSIVFSRDIVGIIFERGAFDVSACDSAAHALAGYSVCFIPYALKTLYSRFMYSHMNTKKPTINSVVSILFNIILSLILYKPLGVFGVAFASSMAELLCAILNIVATKKVNKSIGLNVLCKQIPLWGVGGVMCTIFAIQCKNVWFAGCNNLFRFIVSTIVCGGIYLTCMSPLILKYFKVRTMA